MPSCVTNAFFFHSRNLISHWHHFTEVGESVLVIKGPQGRINRAVWGPLNKTIISAGEDAVVRIWDSEVFIWVLKYYCINIIFYEEK